ncbi:MAG TPA: hypothetical protein VH599_11930 [Ktedonobacterales bacterium]|jgi:hypothetical protein
MNTDMRRSSLRALGAAERGADRSSLPRQVALALLSALSLLTFGAVAVPGHARAASSPRIVFTAPIYTGQNNGFAEGPVGTDVFLKASGWTPPDGTVNELPVTVSLADAQHDTAGHPGSACRNGAQQIELPFIYSTYLPDGNGSFTTSFPWPIDAGTRGHSYWVCGKQGELTSAGVSKFTVLSANPPSVNIAVSQAAPGSTITVTGHNWLPGGIQVQVLVAPCAGCNDPCASCNPPFYTKTRATSGSDGSFSVSARVPSDAPIDTTLYVTAQNIDPNNPTTGNSGTLGAGYSVPIKFTVVAPSALTPASTPAPTAVTTPTAAAAPTGVGVGSAPRSSSDSSSGNLVLLLLLAAMSAVWLISAVVVAWFFLRLRRQIPGTAEIPGRDGPPYGGRGDMRRREFDEMESYSEMNAESYSVSSRLSGPEDQD